MALHTLRIQTLEYDDIASTLTFKLATEEPPLPEGVRADLWFPAKGSFTVVAPVRRSEFVQPSGIYMDPLTQQRWKVTWTGTGWSTPVAVDANGRPQIIKGVI